MEAIKPCVIWGSAARTYNGESFSGDGFVVRPVPHGFVVAVADGLGHGAQAASATRLSLGSVEQGAQDTVITMISRCHEQLKGTRGVALTVARFDTRDHSMTWLGVGNVEGVLWRADLRTLPRTESLLLRNGVVGYQLPGLRGEIIQVRDGDTLILTTDGIRGGFYVDVGLPPQRLADEILARNAKETDDSLVLVVRYTGNGE